MCYLLSEDKQITARSGQMEAVTATARYTALEYYSIDPDWLHT
jgi:hypothetical protein